MERLVRFMESVVVLGSVRLALALQIECRLRIWLEMHARPQSCGGFLPTLANDDGFRQRGQRNARDEDADCRKNLDQSLI